MSSLFKRYLDQQIDKAIYVWGAQGDVLSALHDPEKWIKNQESDPTNRKRAIDLYRARKAAGVWPIRAFDCSGLITYFLQDKMGVMGDKTAQGLYDACIKLKKSELRFGDLVFKGADDKHITHVGVYYGEGITVESKGRDDGVVKTKLNERPWSFFGRLEALQPYLVPEAPVTFSVLTPRVKGDAVRLLQLTLNEAGYTDDNGDMLDCDGVFGRKTAEALDKMKTASGETEPAPDPRTVTIRTAPFAVEVDGNIIVGGGD